MKKLLLLFAFAGMLSVPSLASHLMGGQITSRNLGGLTYEVTLTAYRDTLGIPMYLTAVLNYSDTALIASDTVPVSAPVLIGNGVEVYTYTDTITFPASGSYDIWFEDCCRNAAIMNLLSPGSESMHLNATLFADSTNSSPVFLNAPITVAQLNVPFLYNPMPFDADNDSISWELDVPLSYTGLPAAGFVLPPSDTLVPFTIDSVTGVISFLPNTVGNFVLSVKVHEFRGGVEIGIIRRDMQIIVVSTVNSPVIVTSSSNLPPYSGLDYQIDPGTSFTFNLVTFDPDNALVMMTASGEPLMISNPAVFTVNGPNASRTGSVSWTPDLSQVRSQPYFLNLRVGDSYQSHVFYTDYTLMLRVGAATGINQLNVSNAGLSIYPNPVSSELNMSYTLTNETSVNVEIVNLAGQLMKTFRNVSRGKGVQLVKITNPELQTGIYMVRLIQDNKQIATGRISVK